MKKIKPHSEVASQAILSIAKSFSFNSQKYIPKDGASFSLFKVEIFLISKLQQLIVEHPLKLQ